MTRAAAQAQELVHELEVRGAEVKLLPMVAFAPPEDWSGTDQALERIADFDAILFTSQNAVRFFSQRCNERAVGRRALESSKHLIAAVGTATARAAMEEGLRVDYVARNHTGEGLARELRDLLVGRRILLPRSNRAHERMPTLLREGGADVTEVVAYCTVAPEERKLDTEVLARVRRGDVDAIVFASPSAYQNLRKHVGERELAKLSKRVRFAAIGATTSTAIRNAGAEVAIEARDASAGCLAAAIAKYYEREAAVAKGKPEPEEARRA